MLSFLLLCSLFLELDSPWLLFIFHYIEKINVISFLWNKKGDVFKKERVNNDRTLMSEVDCPFKRCAWQNCIRILNKKLKISLFKESFPEVTGKTVRY